MVSRTYNLIRKLLLRMSLRPVIFDELTNGSNHAHFTQYDSREKCNSSPILINHPSSHTVYRSDIKCQIGRQFKDSLNAIQSSFPIRLTICLFELYLQFTFTGHMIKSHDWMIPEFQKRFRNFEKMTKIHLLKNIRLRTSDKNRFLPIT